MDHPQLQSLTDVPIWAQVVHGPQSIRGVPEPVWVTCGLQIWGGYF